MSRTTSPTGVTACCRFPPPAQYCLVLDSWERNYSLASDLAFEYGSDAGRLIIACFLIRLPDRIGNVEVFFLVCFHSVQQLFCCLCRIGCLDPVSPKDVIDWHCASPPFCKAGLSALLLYRSRGEDREHGVLACQARRTKCGFTSLRKPCIMLRKQS